MIDNEYMDGDTVRSLLKILEYLSADEEKDFECSDRAGKDDHIYHDIIRVGDWLAKNYPYSVKQFERKLHKRLLGELSPETMRNMLMAEWDPKHSDSL